MATQRLFRFKLYAIGAVAAAGLAGVYAVSAVTERGVDRELDDIREHFIPRIGIVAQQVSALDHISQKLAESATAAEPDGIVDARKQEQALLEQLRDAPAAQQALTDYYSTAEGVAKAMIAHGSADPDAVASMQAKLTAVNAQLTVIERTDEQGLTRAFAAASAAEQTSGRVRLGVSLALIIIVLLLTRWIARGLVLRVEQLVTGLRRFGDGDFSQQVPEGSADGLHLVSVSANRMAAQLRDAETDRTRADWIRVGQTRLADELRGELDPDEAAGRALAFLARYVGAPVGVLYALDPDGVLRPLGRFGVTPGGHERVEPGQGLVGEAALQRDVVVIAAPGQLRVRSGVVDIEPVALVLAPLVRDDKVLGVLELAAVTAWQPRATDLLLACRETIAIAIDVARGRTATRALLAETQRQAAELLEARHGLEQKADELTRASTYKSQFLANMSHELRTPLNAILGFAELLHDGAVAHDAPEHDEFLGDILTSGRHLLQLINDVLDLSKIEAGKLELEPERIQLSRIVAEVTSILRTTAAAARIQIETQLDPEVDELVLDPARLKQVLYNYISNAIKFSPERATVVVRARAEGSDRVRIEVEDVGIGIAPEELPRLFGEFSQLAGDGRKRGGTGLGLALTKSIVEMQGGTVGVRSVVGQGSTFHAILPRRARTQPRLTTPPPLAMPSDARSVLVIEDDPRDQAELVAILRDSGYAVEVATTGAAALARCRERTFDAITLDLLLPDMTGLEVLRQIRGGANAKVPVIVITIVAERGSVAGFAVHDILQKPLDSDALLAALVRAGVPSRNGVVLVVDDDPGSLKLMAATLGQLGFRAQCEQDADVAFRSALASPPAAIVLDLLMPGTSGFEFLSRLRSNPAVARLPVIIWTSKDLSVDERATLRASADAVVAKGTNGGAAVLEALGMFLGSREAEVARGG
ncbi:MAG TPA: response regulator [Kofleriaceae bacterium]|jgi:signal transduction histidine kinase/DNA-binding response OmpR family regulator